MGQGRTGSEVIRRAVFALVVAAVAGCGGPAEHTSGEAAPAAEPAVDREAFRRHAEAFRQAYGGGNYLVALESAKAALETAPSVDEPWVWVSSLFSTMGQERQGAEYFDGLTERFPDRPEPWFYRGRHLLRTNELEVALASFERAAALAPADADAVYWQGVILHGMGDADRAADAYREAFRLDPASDRNATMLVRALRETGRYDEASRVTDEALARFPGSADLHYARGQLSLRAADHAAAEPALRRALALDPRHREAHEALATLLLRTGREGEARQAEAMASRLMDYEIGKKNMQSHLSNARDPAVPMLMAELELTERNHAEAVRWFTRAIALGLADERTVGGRAEAHFRAGDVAAGDADLARLGDRGHPRIALAEAARAVAVGDAATARERLATALATGPNEREFLRRAADLYAAIGDVDRAGALHVRAADAPRTSSEPEG